MLSELADRYGAPPEPVLNLLEVARLRAAARRAGLTDVTAAGQHIRFAPVELPDSRQVRVQRLYPKTVLKPAVRTMLVPVPRDVPGARPGATAPPGAPLLRDRELLAWCGQVRPRAHKERRLWLSQDTMIRAGRPAMSIVIMMVTSRRQKESK